jgi:hypothetical protein
VHTPLTHFPLLSVAGPSVFSTGVHRCNHINGNSVDQNLSAPTSSMSSCRRVRRSSSTKPSYTTRTSQRANAVTEPFASATAHRQPYPVSVGVRGPHQKTHCHLLLLMGQTTPTTASKTIPPLRVPPRAGHPRPSGFHVDATMWPAVRRHLTGRFLFQYFGFDFNLRNRFKFQNFFPNDLDHGKMQTKCHLNP